MRARHPIFSYNFFRGKKGFERKILQKIFALGTLRQYARYPLPPALWCVAKFLIWHLRNLTYLGATYLFGETKENLCIINLYRFYVHRLSPGKPSFCSDLEFLV